jgi:hypothetical protein
VDSSDSLDDDIAPPPPLDFPSRRHDAEVGGSSLFPPLVPQTPDPALPALLQHLIRQQERQAAKQARLAIEQARMIVDQARRNEELCLAQQRRDDLMLALVENIQRC